MHTSEEIHPDQIGIEDTQAYRSLGPMTGSSSHESGAGLTVRGKAGDLSFWRVSPRVLRVACSLHRDSAQMIPSQALLPQRSLEGFEVQDQQRALVIRAGEFHVVLDKETLSIQIRHGSDQDGGEYSFSYTGSRLRCQGGMKEEAAIFGLGETTGYLNKRGDRYTMWNSDILDPHVPDMESLYQSIPLLIHHTEQSSVGLFIDHPGRMTVDMRESGDDYDVETIDGEMDLYIIAGKDLREVVSSYTALTGRMQMPPLWSLGYQQSRFSYMNQEEVLELARTFRAKQIPCDVIYLDIHYMNNYKVFSFDPEQFPDPEGMMNELAQMGLRVVPVVNPGVKIDEDYKVYEEGLAERHFCQLPDGELYHGHVWPGLSVFPDFTEERTREWWGALHRFYVDHGISGIWNDMNEPSVFNSPTKTMDEEVLHGNDGRSKTHGELHNIYGMLMCKATKEGLDTLLQGERSFVLTRAGYAGIQRYAAVWTGDNRSYWQHMEMFMAMGMNLGLSGVAFCGADVGGFMHHASGELLIRWTQLGAFTPFFRNHSAIETRKQEPWTFGEQVEEICRKFIELRYSLLPYMYTLFHEAAETGLPVMRPLVLEYPQDRQTFNLSDQFLLGDQIIVAPICRPGTEHRSVYLPEGVWYDFWIGSRHEGGGHHLAHAAIDRIPLFVKSGAIIPMTSGLQHTEGAVWSNLNVHIYGKGIGTDPGQSVTGEYTLYEDDGITHAFEAGEFSRLKIDFLENNGVMEISAGYEYAAISCSGNEREILFTIHHLSFVPAKIDGFNEARSLSHLEVQTTGWYYDRQGNHLFVKVPLMAGHGVKVSVLG
ncbi:TIM-barrel domain-containing protein [Paenibacillus sp. SN-8-1]|uniref:glycoside hydrolase family 31 protein n=1 Tax=Paenibacillus sp. SN-8-1 TaxID=3435409 RepID=UPI003D9A6E4F